MTLGLAAVVLVAVVLMAKSIGSARAETALVIERLGRFHKTVGPGRTTLLIPFVDSIRRIVPLRERMLQIAERQYEIRDGRRLGIAGEVTYRVADAAKATYAVADHEQALSTLVETTFADLARRSEVVDAPLTVREGLDRVRSGAAAWGLDVLTLQPLVTLTPEEEAEIEREVEREFDARVVAFAAERGEKPGPDGAPTDPQRLAYQHHLAAMRETPEYREALVMGEALHARQTGVGAAPKEAVASQPIAPGATGIVEVQGRMFAGRNLSSRAIARGDRCTIERQEGETLLVRGPNG